MSESDADDTPVVAQALRAVADAAQAPTDARRERKDEERMSLFWRVFGGTILSIAALVVITLFNNVTSTITDLRSELVRANDARATAITELRTDLAKSAEARADLIRKDEFNSRMTSSWDRLQNLQQQNNAQNTLITSLKTEIDGLKERLTRQATEGDTIRKEVAAAVEGLKKDQGATTETMKKDIAALEIVKERLMTQAADLKGLRDDYAKIRTEVDKNQAYDFERRDRRDTQYKHIDELLKEMQKGLQDCREKLARFEGQYTPQTKKGSDNKPPTTEK
jgi:chromosome segregation ATPase